MHVPINSFKKALATRQAQIGLWLGLADAYSAELCAGAGFDWLLIDGEHAPNDLRSILGQLQAVAPYASHPVARVPMGLGSGGTALIKQYLDLGVQTLLVPMVDTAEQAAELVRAVRYPPDGIRGMAGARASRWGAYPDYVHEANAQVCLLVQAESALALANLDAIAATPGVDGVFIGPADLSASMGHVGNPGHPDVAAAIDEAIQRIQRAGKAAGILATDEALARRYLSMGATCVAVGLDTQLLARACHSLASAFKSRAVALPASTTY
ncbi:MAG: putative 4-hydroxy-2-oxovalerate aldolase [Polaromonas sp.]|nr:putative 4-hydroxy-2-oxovalerate aldolase [Polaromonas sp.]